jgi:hypothetical protein
MGNKMKKLWIFLTTGVLVAVVLFLIFGKRVDIKDFEYDEPLGI